MFVYGNHPEPRNSQRGKATLSPLRLKRVIERARAKEFFETQPEKKVGSCIWLDRGCIAEMIVRLRPLSHCLISPIRAICVKEFFLTLITLISLMEEKKY